MTAVAVVSYMIPYVYVGTCIFSYLSCFEFGDSPKYSLAAAGAVVAIFEHAPPLFSRADITADIVLDKVCKKYISR